MTDQTTTETAERYEQLLADLLAKFADSDFVRDHDGKHDYGLNPTLREDILDVQNMVYAALGGPATVEDSQGLVPGVLVQADAVPALLCLGCVIEQHRAGAAGIPDEQLPPVNFAQVVINGQSQCLGHVQITDGPVMPGQLPSGIYLPGQG